MFAVYTALFQNKNDLEQEIVPTFFCNWCLRNIFIYTVDILFPQYKHIQFKFCSSPLPFFHVSSSFALVLSRTSPSFAFRSPLPLPFSCRYLRLFCTAQWFPFSLRFRFFFSPVPILLSSSIADFLTLAARSFSSTCSPLLSLLPFF